MVTKLLFELGSKHLYPFCVEEYPMKTHFLAQGLCLLWLGSLL